MSTTHGATTLDTASAFVRAGYSVFRASTDGSKSPLGPWKHAQAERAHPTTVRTWFGDGYPGIGIFTGAVSGNVEMLEFEGRAVAEGLYDRAQTLLRDNGLEPLWATVTTGYRERTPSGGVHLLYKVDGIAVPGSTALAKRPSTEEEFAAWLVKERAKAAAMEDETKAEKYLRKLKKMTPQDVPQVLIETRGEGGFTITAPSHGPVHPTGLPYVLESGGVDTVPTITADDRALLHDLLRGLDHMTVENRTATDRAEPAAPAKPKLEQPADPLDYGASLKPGADYNARGSFDDLLEENGWTLDNTRSDGVQEWRRPGKDEKEGISATVGYGGDKGRFLWVFSTSTEFEALTAYSLFAAYTLLEHKGDYSAAARALRADGYGDQSPAPGEHNSAIGTPETPTEAAPMPGVSWGPVDLSDVVSGLLSGTVERLAPTVGLRDGGGALFYAGKVNGVAGASGSGKSWTALASCLQQIAAGRHVVYVDLEDDALGVVGRLLDLGADPADVLARFHYVNPDESYGILARERLLSMVDELAPTLVVIDSTGESMALDGAKPNDDDDTARWFKSLPSPIARRGPAVLVLDHVVKADDGGLWPIGSQRKRAAISGAQYMQAVVRPFARGQRGAAKLVCSKDRHGAYRAGEKVADLVVEPDGDRLSFTLTAPAATAGVDGATFRPTALMERVSRYLEMVDRSASRSTVTDRVQGNRTALLQALDVLKAEGHVDVTIGPRKAELCVSVRPYRQEADPRCDLFTGTQERVEPADPSPTPPRGVPHPFLHKEEERGTGEDPPCDPFLGTGQERVRNGSEDTDDDGSSHCGDCGQELFLRLPGRTTCERCRLAVKAAS